MHKLLLLILFAVGWGFGTAQGAVLCKVGKDTRLAMDQRDDLRMKCLKQKKSHLSVDQCLNISAQMEYSTNAEDARLVCLYDLRRPPSLQECHKITKAMEFPDTGDETRWECLRRHNTTISRKKCLNLARAMSYPANEQRALSYCEHELP